MGHEIENDEVIQPHRGDQSQVGGPQMPLPGHGDEKEIQNWVYEEQLGTQMTCEPWGYVAPAVAAVVTRATGVRHIYLISRV